ELARIYFSDRALGHRRPVHRTNLGLHEPATDVIHLLLRLQLLGSVESAQSALKPMPQHLTETRGNTGWTASLQKPRREIQKPLRRRVHQLFKYSRHAFLLGDSKSAKLVHAGRVK